MDIKVGTRTFNIQVGRLSNAAHTSQHLVIDGTTLCGKEPITVGEPGAAEEAMYGLTSCDRCRKSAKLRRIPLRLPS